MAKKKILIKELRSFFKSQEEQFDLAATPDDDLSIIKQILIEPNPGVVRAKKEGFSITVAKGDTIYKIDADNTQTEIGKVSRKDVTITEQNFYFQ